MKSDHNDSDARICWNRFVVYFFETFLLHSDNELYVEPRVLFQQPFRFSLYYRTERL